MTHEVDLGDLMTAFDEWEAAADTVDLLMVDRARGLPVDSKLLEQARRNLVDRQARWEKVRAKFRNHSRMMVARDGPDT